MVLLRKIKVSIIFFAATSFFIVGLFTNYWLGVNGGAGETVHMGLWNYCTSSGCASIDHSCKFASGDVPSCANFRTIRAFAIMAAIISGLAGLLQLTSLFLEGKGLSIAAQALGVIAGVFGIVAFALFVSYFYQSTSPENFAPVFSSLTYGYSFALIGSAWMLQVLGVRLGVFSLADQSMPTK